MTKYHAVMLDELGFEFGVSVEADSKEEAYTILEEDYCESQCVQLESPADTEARNLRMYESLSREDGYDEEDYYDDED